MRSYHVKENLNGSVVSEILRYKHTDKHTQTNILLLYCKDINYSFINITLLSFSILHPSYIGWDILDKIIHIWTIYL